ncbi:response regulator transcription factor [Ammoniphilus sp. YIM 78166]|uniref:response regulator transcription factor n=1 Tax=Ammoniphilus sp. YIM 78166 TaxID=1644106 RepID=UPI00106F6D95|nr:response regulator [Ammoniphilus sp. YIM 78166]
MAVLVQDPIQELTQQLAQWTQSSYEHHLSCGVILAPCANLGPKVLDPLKAFLKKSEPELSAHYMVDDQNQILGVVLDNQKLAGTHYSSLVLKDFLDRLDVLEGQMVVASFPESGEPTKRTLLQLSQTIMEAKGESREIQLFVDASMKEGVSSILVVDPDEVNREFVKLRLELKGYEVHEARDGSEALEKYSELTPELVITELNVPIVDGYQLIHQIKQKGGEVIVLTDKQLSKDMNRAFELGASDYVTKPFSISELEWRIKKLRRMEHVL